MDSRLKLKITLAVFSAILSVRAVAAGTDATVYFLPFRIETYVAVTRVTIETEAADRLMITEPSQVKRLLALLNGGVKAKPGEFSENRIRAKIITGDQIYYIDAEGVVEKGSTDTKIDTSEFVKFRASLRDGQFHLISRSEH